MATAPPFPPPPPAPDTETLIDILSKAYGSGSRDDYVALDRVTQAVLGKTLGVDFKAFGDGSRDLVNPVFDAIDQAGKFDAAVSAFYQALPWSEPLRTWVATYAPGIAGLVSDEAFAAAKLAHAKDVEQRAANQADAVVAAINAITAASNQAQVQHQVDDSRLALVALAGQLQTLNAYKAIHDRLHGLQTGFYQSVAGVVGRSVGMAGQTVALTPDQSDLIRLEGQRVTEGAETLDQFLAIADGDDSAPSRDWRASLGEAIDGILQEPIVLDRARGGLLVVRGILRQQLTVYDDALARVAGALPLGRIVVLLRDAGKLDNVPDSVAAAAGDLDAMSKTLGGRVELHRQWQLIEATLWPIEQELSPGPVPPNKYALGLYLDQLNKQLAAVKAVSPDTWDANIDGVLAAASAALAEGVDPSPTATAFADLIRIVRLQFSKIDKMLLSQCAQIVKLGKPLRQLLAGGS